MQPRKEIDIPEQVNLFQLLVTRLGDYTALEEDDDIHANIAAFAGFMNSEDGEWIDFKAISLYVPPSVDFLE